MTSPIRKLPNAKTDVRDDHPLGLTAQKRKCSNSASATSRHKKKVAESTLNFRIISSLSNHTFAISFLRSLPLPRAPILPLELTPNATTLFPVTMTHIFQEMDWKSSCETSICHRKEVHARLLSYVRSIHSADRIHAPISIDSTHLAAPGGSEVGKYDLYFGVLDFGLFQLLQKRLEWRMHSSVGSYALPNKLAHNIKRHPQFEPIKGKGQYYMFEWGRKNGPTNNSGSNPTYWYENQNIFPADVADDECGRINMFAASIGRSVFTGASQMPLHTFLDQFIVRPGVVMTINEYHQHMHRDSLVDEFVIVHCPLNREGMWIRILDPDNSHRVVHIPFGSYLVLPSKVFHAGVYGSKFNYRFHLTIQRRSQPVVDGHRSSPPNRSSAVSTTLDATVVEKLSLHDEYHAPTGGVDRELLNQSRLSNQSWVDGYCSALASLGGWPASSDRVNHGYNLVPFAGGGLI